MTFEWDDAKAEANLRKHGVSFKEAQVVFVDEFAIEDHDADHSSVEETRFRIIGMGYRRIVFVVYVVRDEIAERYRIITARKAEKELEKVYWDERKKQEK